jgi:hypothetical protein
MMSHIAIIGREKNLALAELESVFGNTEVITEDVVRVDNSDNISINRLGSVIKIARVLLNSDNRNNLVDIILKY